jgi:bis(5'-nucleosidyl)-tetraphosphatase
VATKEFSFGIIPLRKIEKEWQVLLVKHEAGNYWAFPKGHAEQGEEPIQTAQRELFEETGLTITKFFKTDVLEEKYYFKKNNKLIYKTVQYYLAEVTGSLKIQKSEISESHWININDAVNLITFSESKRLCFLVMSLLKNIF